MRIFECSFCNSKITEADKSWDILNTFSKCPNCSQPVENFKLFKNPNVEPIQVKFPKLPWIILMLHLLALGILLSLVPQCIGVGGGGLCGSSRLNAITISIGGFAIAILLATWTLIETITFIVRKVRLTLQLRGTR
jgi:hypothetical protein